MAKGDKTSEPDIVYLRPAQLREMLKSLIPTGCPIWIHGKPGVGKTSIVRDAAEKDLDIACPHFPPAVTLDPVDTRGLPCIHTGPGGARQTVWAPPSFWPQDPDWRGVIFVDELPQADKAVQSSFLQLTYGGRLGDYVVPKAATFVVCGNRAEDRAGTGRVITPLLNRFIHLGLETCLDDWMEWAAGAGVSGVVRGFLRYRPKAFDTFDPSTHQTAFASPRSWERADRVYAAGLPEHLLHAAVAGCVGIGPAAEFIGYVRTVAALPDLWEILKAPKKAFVPQQPDVCYALAGALADLMGKATADQMKAFLLYIERLDEEYNVLAMRDAMIIQPNLCLHADAWVDKFGHLIRQPKAS